MHKKKLMIELKKLQFTKEITPIFDLVDLYIDRVEFVKDHVGLKNFVFLAEKDAYRYDYPYFANFNVETTNEGDMQYFTSVNKTAIYNANSIHKELKEKFEQTNETIYIEIGFKSAMPSQEEQFRVYQLLKSKECTNIQEALLKVRVFPSWYAAKPSKEVMIETHLLDQLELAEKRLLAKLKTDLLVEIDLSLANNDKKKFATLSKRLKKVCEELV